MVCILQQEYVSNLITKHNLVVEHEGK